VEHKKIDVLFGIFIVGFMAVTFLMFKELNNKRTSDLKEYSNVISNIVKQKNDKIRFFYAQLVEKQNELLAKEKENDDLKKTLTDTRNSLESITKRLTQPATAPAVVPAAQAAPATPVAATK